MKSIIYVSCLFVLLYGCGNSKELEKLRAENVELKQEAEKQAALALKATKMVEHAMQEAEKQNELAVEQAEKARQAIEEAKEAAKQAARKAKDCL